MEHSQRTKRNSSVGGALGFSGYLASFSSDENNGICLFSDVCSEGLHCVLVLSALLVCLVTSCLVCVCD